MAAEHRYVRQPAPADGYAMLSARGHYSASASAREPGMLFSPCATLFIFGLVSIE